MIRPVHQQRGPAPAVADRWRVVLTWFVAWSAFAYRFVAPDFYNDHFEHLSMARQMRFGELPMRDFADPGRPLTVALSAMGQAVAANLLSEAVLTIGALAIGAAITFRLASRAARSLTIGVIAAFLVIAIHPRLYSYPKILVFAIVLLALWRYVDVPSRARLVVLAGACVFALLMRHDFGVYAGLTSAVTVLVTPRLFAWRRTLLFAVVGVAMVAPYVVWLGRIGYVSTIGSSGALAMADMATSTRALPIPRVNFSQGIAHVDPTLARIRVRWSANITPAARRGAAAKYGLIAEEDTCDQTFAYGLTDVSTANLRALVNDPAVEDTSGLDRRTLTLDGPAVDRWIRRLPLSRITWGPFFDPDSAAVWLFYVVWAIPLVALFRLLLARARVDTLEWRLIGSASLLGILLNVYLIRGSLDSRLPDVVVPAAVVGAWLVAGCCRWVARTPVRPAQVVLAVAALALAVLSWSALTTYESSAGVGRLATAGFRLAALGRAGTELRERPLDEYAPRDATGVRLLTRYVHECLQPDDRLLLVAYEPQVFYYSERLFAGGMEYFHQGRFSSAPELARTVDRLAQQRVPLVIIERGRAGMFAEAYRPVYDYVQAHYRHAATTTFLDRGEWDVFAEKTRPGVSAWEGQLPCYQ